ncbi:MAG: isoleucine--tRNA ligase [Atopobiaceae bacterium]|nr:isoleucine--tRNA ligase [Atopobiaceae bacterium]MCH4180955.1 isoleucine--tRNA ligase [Atopobiaceae bacterium]MCH4214037.1 isoleucine--tRNA ligase [Atopobiaceae bacterium]MCH4276849.1 isoleucine--tRNA ligase [Atopobiaceae bacterium]MCI1227301.1 isoleucine--tRNA ligase [Atopobiaceae bacterium]
MANTFKKTMNLPKTDFPMRAGLAKREPERLASWYEDDVYSQMLKKNEGHPRFVLHDGPPYANGPIHIGHALNKISKDIINRYWSMRGYQTPYVPGWDCHGQPIEHKVEETLGTKKFNETPTPEVRTMCREFAVENIDIQRQGFKRLGVLGDWDHPYLTLVNDYDAADIEIFKKIFDKGAIYRGRKPVHWCKHCHTALAEAEIEYSDEVSPSIYVRFVLTSVPAGLEAYAGKVDVVVWTTTPWTMPADTGVILGPEFDYVAVLHDGRAEIMASALAEKVCGLAGWDYELVSVNGSEWHATGDDLVGNTYTQPIFDDFEGRFITADYVTLDDGTGVVHTAPGHGVDDYNAGMKWGLELVMPVDDDGRFFKGEGIGTGGPFSGMDTDEANPHVIDFLRDRGTLVAAIDITHSYPHCWRCKRPVIFRATDQWFVSMDKTGLRDQALDAIQHSVRWYPSHASKRITAMVEGRPDWCISRQRCWGVPIPSFTCADCGEKVMNDDTLDAIIKLFHEKGSDAWFTDDPASYLGNACTCPSCGGHHLTADTDILDVWWDSGVSHTAVLGNRPELRFPADMYLEGSDQHRGWFQSSLLTSVGAYGCAPFKSVVSQGFVLDGKGRKMSKSVGNVIDPNKVCDERGADIVRLWVASCDTSTDVACDHDILDHVGDAYRRFRNTFRFLLGELDGQFDPTCDTVPEAELDPYDRLVLARLTKVHEEVAAAYADYRFNVVYRTLYDFVITELSNGYLNATKDRMYCSERTSAARRSAQTCWGQILSMLLHDLQPILAFTCDEVMSYVPESLRDGRERAALLDWYVSPMADAEADRLVPCYDAMLEVRAAFTKAYEEAVGSGLISEKTTQAARAKVVLPQEGYDLLTGPDAPDLAEVLVCSEVVLAVGDSLSCEVMPAEGERCERCWNWRKVGKDGLCPRCHDAVEAADGCCE